MLSFQRPAGAKADCKEIEFVSAIHQAVLSPRKDGSITAFDVSHFLLSRYGIEVPEEEIRKTIIKGYGGGEEKEECIDLAELTATLLIPYLLKECRRSVSSLSARAVKRDVDGDITSDGHSDIIGFVLKMILGDVSGSPTPTSIDHDLIRRILITYGEPELAQDNGLVHDMFLAATDGQEGVQLDEHSFAKAITGDIQHYDLESESAPTSNYFDVFPTKEEYAHGGAVASSTEEESPSSQLEINRPKEVRTAAGIDFVSDTHRSKLFTVLLWAFLIMTQHTYLPDPLETGYAIESCGEDDFACTVEQRIIQWILLTIYYSIGGTLFITVGSLGNSFETKSIWPPIISVIAMVAAAVAPVAIIATNGEDEDRSFEYKSSITLALGIAVASLQIIYLFGRSPNNKKVKNTKGLRRIFSFLHNGNTLLESYAKQAAVLKMRLMVSNAVSIHSPIDEIEFARDKSCSAALLNYGKMKDSVEACGGLWWTWHRIFSWKLSKKEGILIPSKLITANILQLIMSVFVLVLLWISTNNIASSDNIAIVGGDSNLPDAIRTGGHVGAVASFIACLAISLSYLPSIVTTTMKLRCGVIPSLEDENFSKYIAAPDSVSKVPGSMFWAVFFAGGATYVVWAFVVFSFVFENTRNFAFSVVSQIIGFLIPTIIQMLILLWLRSRFYAGHYRTKPVSANFVGLALQCLDYGLAYGFMWFRTVKLILVSIYFIGRVDTPLFAREVASFGAFDIDDAPTHFRKLIIAHEAHRHPYVEVLGKMYLLKLRYREEFGRTSGSRWRMIFVSALMPWMRRHRVLIENNSPADAGFGNIDSSTSAGSMTEIFDDGAKELAAALPRRPSKLQRSTTSVITQT